VVKPESQNFLLLLFGKNYGIYLITGYLPDGYLPSIHWVFTYANTLQVFTSGFLRFP